MDTTEFVEKKVNYYYRELDLNCATTVLKILAEKFNLTLTGQVFDSAIGMHGAGKYGAQCGLVEGTLMFLGIAGRQKKIPDREIVDFCFRFAADFEKEFGSLLCRKLRPQGFSDDNPPHLCEPLTRRAICFSIDEITRFFSPCC